MELEFHVDFVYKLKQNVCKADFSISSEKLAYISNAQVIIYM